MKTKMSAYCRGAGWAREGRRHCDSVTEQMNGLADIGMGQWAESTLARPFISTLVEGTSSWFSMEAEVEPAEIGSQGSTAIADITFS